MSFWGAQVYRIAAAVSLATVVGCANGAAGAHHARSAVPPTARYGARGGAGGGPVDQGVFAESARRRMLRVEYATRAACSAGRATQDALVRVAAGRTQLERQLAAAGADGVFTPREVAVVDALVRATAAATGQLALVTPGVVP